MSRGRFPARRRGVRRLRKRQRQVAPARHHQQRGGEGHRRQQHDAEQRGKRALRDTRLRRPVGSKNTRDDMSAGPVGIRSRP
ncbi:hypothetical protein AB5I41_26675 [Sphingomonas sp. MMS24-JH45]